MMHVASAEALNATYLWAGIVVGAVALVGGFRALFKGASAWVANDMQQKANMAMVPDLAKRMAAIEKAIAPNGKDTDQIGDIAARVEDKIDALDSKLDEHIGGEKEARAQIWEAVHKLQEAP